MAYTAQTWKDGAAGKTPLTAARLNHIETGINDKAAKGDKGDPGAILISEKSPGDVPSSYPEGLSYCDGKLGWPVDYGTVETLFINVDRARQTFTAKEMQRHWLRTAFDDVWSEWAEMGVKGADGKDLTTELAALASRVEALEAP